jgi:hypothetical protein
MVRALAVVVAASAGGMAFAAHAAAPTSSPNGHHRRGCPHTPLRLPAAAVAGAARVALRQAPTLYPGIDTRGRVVNASARAPSAFERGRQVESECGRRVFHRTVVVSMTFPRMQPSASLSESVVFVARFRHGYRVWEVAH